MTKQDNRTRWMMQFDEAVSEAAPDHPGSINWDAAAYHFNTGKTPEQAADAVISSNDFITLRY